MGCGNGNISKYLLQKQKRGKKNEFFASDISKQAISMAKKNYSKKINFRAGNLFQPWKNEKFNIIISDVSSINCDTAKLSPWYRGIVYSSGKDGLKNVKNILKEISNYSKKNTIFILPVISLCNVTSLTALLKKKFKKILLTKKIEWPLPLFFQKNIKKFKVLKASKNIEYKEKFGIYIAYTRVAICIL